MPILLSVVSPTPHIVVSCPIRDALTQERILAPSPMKRNPTYLPELLARVLPTHSLQDLRATWVFLYKGVHLIHVAIHYYVQSLLDCVVFGDLLRGEGLGHRVGAAEGRIGRVGL
jgi:hypothetical protein